MEPYALGNICQEIQSDGMDVWGSINDGDSSARNRIKVYFTSERGEVTAKN